MKITGAVLVSFLLIGAESALADDAADCQSAPDAAQAIAACTRIIGSGTLTGHNLALAYNHRGLATSRTGQVRTVVSDLN